MKPNLLALLLALCCGTANAVFIDFDSLIEPGTFGPKTGHGFSDSGYVFSNNMDVIDISPTGTWWSIGVSTNHSGKFAALNNYGGTMEMTKAGGGMFFVEEFLIHSWHGHPTPGTIQGVLNNVVVETINLSLSTPWKSITLHHAVDALRISATGYGIFLVDDMRVHALPEPETAALTMACLGLAGMLARRRESA